MCFLLIFGLAVQNINWAPFCSRSDYKFGKYRWGTSQRKGDSNVNLIHCLFVRLDFFI